MNQEVHIQSADRSPLLFPVTVFERLRHRGPFPVVLWRTPEGDIAVAAGIAERMCEVCGEDWRTAFASSAGDFRHRVTNQDTRLLFSVHFDPARDQGAAWAAYPPLQLALPQLLVYGNENGAKVQTAGATALDAELSAWLDTADVDEAHEVLGPLSAQIDWNEVPFQIAVEHVLRAIRRGSLSKAVLARHVRVTAERDIGLAQLLRTLSDLYPDCFLYAQASGPRSCFVSATPERLVEVRDGVVRTAALAGTAPTGRTLVEEQQNRQLLLTNSKLWREHSMVTEMIHAGLSGISESVQLSAPEILRLRNVQHLCTPITATLKTSASFVDALLALHPTPAVCGTPQHAALDVIRRLEAGPRGLYAGAAGWMDARGSGDAAVLIRSGLIEGSEARLFAGAGMVSESSVKQELDETRVKLQAMLSALAVS